MAKPKLLKILDDSGHSEVYSRLSNIIVVEPTNSTTLTATDVTNDPPNLSKIIISIDYLMGSPEDITTVIINSVPYYLIDNDFEYTTLHAMDLVLEFIVFSTTQNHYLVQLSSTTRATNYTATIPNTSWTGSTAPYTKYVEVDGLKDDDTPTVDIVPTGTYATDVIMRENWSLIYDIDVYEDYITVYADEVPSAEIPIILKVVK